LDFGFQSSFVIRHSSFVTRHSSFAIRHSSLVSRIWKEKTHMPKLGFIGAGPVGTTFGVRLSQQKYPVVAVFDLSQDAAKQFADRIPGCRILQTAQYVVDAAELIFITTPDDYIAKVAGSLKWQAGKSAVHCSGATTLRALDGPKAQGALVGGIHPCQTFAGIEQAIENLPGSTFAIEAEEPLQATLTEMAKALDGDWLYLTAEQKALYHAAACIACNYFDTVVSIACDLWQHFGKTPADALRAYTPLLRGAVNNLTQVGLPAALTGPIARGDVKTIHHHLESIGKYQPDLLPLYKELGSWTIPIARGKGTLAEDKAAELKKLLKDHRG
jgi:predicted short-subunit dehydrogenase-like oxidoreductase (DUF2520 family)